MPVETLTYETPQFLQKLIGHDLGGLRVIAAGTETQITSRDAWVRIEGADAAAVGAAREVLTQLERLRRQGGEITSAMIGLVTESVLTGHDDAAPASSILTLKLAGSAKKPPVLAKTRGQIAYVQAMRDHEIVFGVGPAGTGKTYLAMAQGLHYLREKTVQRLVLTRPAVEAGEALGFLPGDLKEKIFPYLRPLYDALYDMLEPDEAERMIERGAIEIAPLAYMRGRTLKNAFIILDEAQNTTTEQMLMFLTRLGEGARAVVTGDPSQVDLRRHVRSGLREAVEVLQGVEGMRFVQFLPKDIVRLPVVQRIIEAYDRRRAGGESRGAADGA
ncbi:MAG TPA: phosphate starvation-inducible protein PhoH [Verrucomicrobiales bacterium]|nr:phosphate starvation-inducible protein PhoH [Verrucomicrobiales bacterium]